MAAFDYDTIGAEAIALIKDFAKPTLVQLLRNVDGTPPDAEKPWRVGTPSTLSFNLQAVVLPFPQALTAPTVYQDLTVIAPGDAETITANEDATKLVGTFFETDRMLIDGQTYDVKGSKLLAPGTSSIMYILRLKVWLPTTNQRLTQF